MAQALAAHLEAGCPVSSFEGRGEEAFQELAQEMRFLSAKPIIYVANVDEASLVRGNAYLRELEALAEEEGSAVVAFCARLEADLAGLGEEEQREYLALAGVEQSGLDQIIRRSYELLNLISFFTFNEREVRAWTIEEGWSAPRAAGVIHTDFDRG